MIKLKKKVGMEHLKSVLYFLPSMLPVAAIVADGSAAVFVAAESAVGVAAAVVFVVVVVVAAVVAVAYY